MEEDAAQFQFGINQAYSDKLDKIRKEKRWNRTQTAIALIEDVLTCPEEVIHDWEIPLEKEAEKYFSFHKGGDFVKRVDDFVREGRYPWSRRRVVRVALQVGIDLYLDNMISEKTSPPIMIDEKVLRSLVTRAA